MRTAGALVALLLSTSVCASLGARAALAGVPDGPPPVTVEEDEPAGDGDGGVSPEAEVGDDADEQDIEAAAAIVDRAGPDEPDADAVDPSGAELGAASRSTDDDDGRTRGRQRRGDRAIRRATTGSARVPASTPAAHDKHRIAASVPRQGRAPSQPTWHIVQSGQTLTMIARQHGCTIAELREANRLTGELIRPDQRLRIPAAGAAATLAPRLPAIAVVAGQSVGQPWRGRLRSGVRFPDGIGYLIRRPLRAWGASHVVTQLQRAIASVRTRFPSLHTLAIGDLSARRGGAITEHRSHQSGRDVDVGLYYTTVPRGYPQSFMLGTDDNLDKAATWALLYAFARSADQPSGVSAIFLDFDVQGLLYTWALDHAVPRAYLDRLFQYPHGRDAAAGLVRHAANHGDHLHVRFKCPPDDAGCR